MRHELEAEWSEGRGGGRRGTKHPLPLWSSAVEKLRARLAMTNLWRSRGGSDHATELGSLAIDLPQIVRGHVPQTYGVLQWRNCVHLASESCPRGGP